MANIICAVVLSGLGLFFITVNTVLFYKGWIKGEKCPSVALLLGGILCAVAILLVVDKKYYFLAIIPMLLDWGCIPAIIRFIVVIRYKDMFNETGKIDPMLWQKIVSTFIKYYTATVVFIFVIPTVIMYLMFFRM